MLKSLRVAAVCAAAVLASSASAFAAAGWTQFRAYGSNNAVVGGNLDVRWEVRTDGRISASPTYVHGMLFIGTNSGTLYAIDAKNGQIAWQHHLENALMSDPLVYRGLVIVGEGNAGDPYPLARTVGTGKSAIVAFDERSGAIRWKTPLQGSGMPTPAIVDGVLVHHDGSGNITGMDPMTGRVLYRRDLQSIASMNAAVPVGKDSFVTSGVLHNAVYRVKARTGRVIWRTSPFPGHASGIGDCPMATNGKLLFGDYVYSGRPDTLVAVGKPVREYAYALNARTGALVWDIPLEEGPLPIRNESGVPVLEKGVLYIGGAAAPWVNAIDVKTGRLLWRKEIYGPVKGGFAVKNGVLYFGDFAGYLWALDARTGKQIGVKPMSASFNVGSPIIVGKTLIIGSLRGVVYAVPLKVIRRGSL